MRVSDFIRRGLIPAARSSFLACAQAAPVVLGFEGRLVNNRNVLILGSTDVESGFTLTPLPSSNGTAAILGPAAGPGTNGTWTTHALPGFTNPASVEFRGHRSHPIAIDKLVINAEANGPKHGNPNLVTAHAPPARVRTRTWSTPTPAAPAAPGSPARPPGAAA